MSADSRMPGRSAFRIRLKALALISRGRSLAMRRASVAAFRSTAETAASVDRHRKIDHVLPHGGMLPEPSFCVR